MIRQLIPTILIAAIGPMSLGHLEPNAMTVDLRTRPTVEQMIVTEATEQGVPAHLALALAWRESRLDSTKVSHRNRDGSFDCGLFQINSRTARILHMSHPLDAQQNIIAAVGLLKVYRGMCRSDAAMFFAYAHGRCK